MMNYGIYGQYNVEVLKENGESYFPFGSGYKKNLIVDDFLQKITSGYKHGPQAWMQTCITNTGNSPATRHDTTGTFGVPNDVTWASNVFYEEVDVNNKHLIMFRDFQFDPVVNNPKTYREAMVGLFYKDSSNQAANIESDIALSHFVFSEDVVVQPGDRLKINYRVNLVLDYLSAEGSVFQLSGDGYNFDGRIKLMSNFNGIFSNNDNTYTYFSYEKFTQSYYNADQIFNLRKPINSNSNSYEENSSSSNNYQIDYRFLGTKIQTDMGFYGSAGWTPSTYPTVYSPGNGVLTPILGDSPIISKNNFQLNDDGASIDINYYFLPSSSDRDAHGILFTRKTYFSYDSANQLNQKLNEKDGSMLYLAFDNPQTIKAFDSIYLQIRWAIRRL